MRPLVKTLLTFLDQVVAILTGLLMFALLGYILKDYGIEPDLGVVAMLFVGACLVGLGLRRGIAALP